MIKELGEIIPDEKKIEVRVTLPRTIMGVVAEPTQLLRLYDVIVEEGKKALAKYLEQGGEK